jgi:hypothetical protein
MQLQGLHLYDQVDARGSEQIFYLFHRTDAHGIEASGLDMN